MWVQRYFQTSNPAYMVLRRRSGQRWAGPGVCEAGLAAGEQRSRLAVGRRTPQTAGPLQHHSHVCRVLARGPATPQGAVWGPRLAPAWRTHGRALAVHSCSMCIIPLLLPKQRGMFSGPIRAWQRVKCSVILSCACCDDWQRGWQPLTSGGIVTTAPCFLPDSNSMMPVKLPEMSFTY